MPPLLLLPGCTTSCVLLLPPLPLLWRILGSTLAFGGAAGVGTLARFLTFLLAVCAGLLRVVLLAAAHAHLVFEFVCCGGHVGLLFGFGLLRLVCGLREV